MLFVFYNHQGTIIFKHYNILFYLVCIIAYSVRTPESITRQCVQHPVRCKSKNSLMQVIYENGRIIGSPWGDGDTCPPPKKKSFLVRI